MNRFFSEGEETSDGGKSIFTKPVIEVNRFLSEGEKTSDAGETIFE